MSKLIINYNVQISEKISKLFETSESSWTPEVCWGKGERGSGGGRGPELIICKFVPPLAMARLGQPHPHYAVITISLTQRDFKERSNISADIFSIL